MVGKFANVILLLIATIVIIFPLQAQHSVARQWNEALLEAIRTDFARPTVHARNLFHASVAMYDAWAAYDDVATTYLLGNNVRGFPCPFSGVPQPDDLKQAREEAISYASYRLLSHRFRNSPGAVATQNRLNELMATLGYDINYTSIDYNSGSPAALGNYIGRSLIDYGYQDGANEAAGYKNKYYQPVNPPLFPIVWGNADIKDPNRWQPIGLDVFIDQSGHSISELPEFLGPEWGRVAPFALEESNLNIYERNGHEYWVYHDPGPPPYLGKELSDEYKWGFALVSAWSSHLYPADSVMLDISPASIGNIENFPLSIQNYRNFYDFLNGGDTGKGHDVNPHTGAPYTPQVVPRGDYTRVLAEFWADGPASETPPGHWFTILNYVTDHPLFERRTGGKGPVVDELEWDVKAYLTLGGAMHDCAVTAWGLKGWYDYVRPVSAIRYMADQGQSSDVNLPNYSENGIPLIESLIEVVEAGDPLDGGGANVGKVKIYSWRGPDYIANPDKDMAGVGWILAENWWPYQRPSFVTPPFAGYLSGHSTFSRAAAEVLTLLTGDAYFPGGMGEFKASKNEFLVFEEGPSVDITLQWATYRDASDQTSLSRIWGGIHPPADDTRGRLIGKEIGIKSYEYAKMYFDGVMINGNIQPVAGHLKVYPNPVSHYESITIEVGQDVSSMTVKLVNQLGQVMMDKRLSYLPVSGRLTLNLNEISAGVYILHIKGSNVYGSFQIRIH